MIDPAGLVARGGSGYENGQLRRNDPGRHNKELRLVTPKARSRSSVKSDSAAWGISWVHIIRKDGECKDGVVVQGPS